MSLRTISARLLGTLALALLVTLPLVSFSKDAPPSKTIGTIETKELPKQALDTLALVRKGGPFPYSKDGTTFGNRERILPSQPRGHYREYTVKTPGSRDRGARRIVCGGEKQTTCYYTSDHYASFKRIVE